MATVVLAASAVADLDRLIATHSLPGNSRECVRAVLKALSTFPLLGPALSGAWQEFRFVLGPWPWMLIVYVFDEEAGRVAVVTIQDARSARSATSQR